MNRQPDQAIDKLDRSRRQNASPGPRRAVALAVCGLLLLAIALIYGQTVRCEFTNYDEQMYVCKNPQVNRGLTLAGIGWAMTTKDASMWAPLTWLSHMLDCQLYGLAPWGHHLTNVLLHAATTVLLLLVLWQMTGHLWPSAFVAALFAIHPLHVEAVAWVAERKGLLSGLFFVLTLGAYVHFVRRPFSWLNYLAIAVLLALGLMAKPVLVTMPVLLLLLDYWPLGRWNPAVTAPLGRWSFPWRLVAEKVPLLALAAASSVAAPITQGTAVASLNSMPLWTRLGNAAVSYVAYIGRLFYPVDLAVFYPHLGTSLPGGRAIGALLILAAVSAAALLNWRRFPYLFVGWFWYLGTLVPMIGLVQVGQHAMANRYTYVTQIGLYMAIAWGAAQAIRNWPGSRRACCLVATLVVACSLGCAWHQTTFWHDSLALWTRALNCTLDNAVVRYNLGVSLAERGRLGEAIDHYDRALEMTPQNADARFNLALALAKVGRTGDAVTNYWKVLEIAPRHMHACNDLAWLLATYPSAALRNGTDAVVLARRAVQITESRDPNALDTLAAAYAEVKQFPKAVATLQQAVELAVAQGNRTLADELRTRLKLYQAGSPYRETPKQQNP
jgi:protein O-mannosyl-transferase